MHLPKGDVESNYEKTYNTLMKWKDKYYMGDNTGKKQVL